MPARSRKRGRHAAPAPDAPRASAPAASPAPPAPEPEAPAQTPPRPSASREPRPLPSHLPPPRESRSEARNAEIRATLQPFRPGERPPIVLLCTAIAAGLALANLIAWLAGDTINGTRPAATGILIFTAVLGACAIGLWQMRSGAVLGFMTLMAIIAVLFTLFLIEASNWLGAVVALAIVLVSGYLFFKLVRVLSRLQAPRR